MNEEMNRHEAELNEAALEGVSGGYFAEETAEMICAECRAQNIPCMGSIRKMIELIGRKGYAPSPRDCPYRG